MNTQKVDPVFVINKNTFFVKYLSVELWLFLKRLIALMICAFKWHMSKTTRLSSHPDSPISISEPRSIMRVFSLLSPWGIKIVPYLWKKFTHLDFRHLGDTHLVQETYWFYNVFIYVLISGKTFAVSRIAPILSIWYLKRWVIGLRRYSGWSFWIISFRLNYFRCFFLFLCKHFCG